MKSYIQRNNVLKSGERDISIVKPQSRSQSLEPVSRSQSADPILRSSATSAFEPASLLTNTINPKANVAPDDKPTDKLARVSHFNAIDLKVIGLSEALKSFGDDAKHKDDAIDKLKEEIEDTKGKLDALCASIEELGKQVKTVRATSEQDVKLKDFIAGTYNQNEISKSNLFRDTEKALNSLTARIAAVESII